MKTLRNFRDIGGLKAGENKKIKKGLLFRSADLDKLDKHDTLTFHSFNIKTIIDLRSPFEREKYKKNLTKIERGNLPLSFDEPTRVKLKPLLHKKNSESKIIDICNSVYIEMVDAFIPHLKPLFEILLSDKIPALIHCRAGKDRTGTLCAIIQSALGIKREEIISDYLKTNESILIRLIPAMKFMKTVSLGFFPVNNLKTAFTANEKYILTALERIKYYGGIEKYLALGGVSKEAIEELKNKYLEVI